MLLSWKIYLFVAAIFGVFLILAILAGAIINIAFFGLGLIFFLIAIKMWKIKISYRVSLIIIGLILIGISMMW